MKVPAKLCALIVFVIILSCEKVIDIPSRESDLRHVIEGVITNEPGVCWVLISETQHFNLGNEFKPVSGAYVSVRDEGREFILTETSPGKYEATGLNGIPGHTYMLHVRIGNQEYNATSRMPMPVILDTMYISPGPFGDFLFPNVAFSDPAGITNHYRFVQYRNGRKDPAIFWENDEFGDGEMVTLQLDNGITEQDDIRAIGVGDTVTIEMLCIDEPVYKYWYSMEFSGGGGDGNVAAPSNPISNIKGGALGYFSAHSIDRRTEVVR